MDMATAVAIVGSVVGLSLGTANIFRTLYGKNFCDKHEAVSKELQEMKEEKATIEKLVEVTQDFEDMLKESSQDRKLLHEEVRNVFSHIGDMKTVLSLIGYELMANSPNLNIIQDLVKRKAHQ